MPLDQITIPSGQPFQNVAENSLLYRGDHLLFLQTMRGFVVVDANSGAVRFYNTFAVPNSDPPIDGIYPGRGDGYQPVGAFGVSEDATIIAHNNRARQVWVSAPAVHFWRLDTTTLNAVHLGGSELGEHETPVEYVAPAVYSDSAWFFTEFHVPDVANKRGWRGVRLDGSLGGWMDVFPVPPVPGSLVDGTRYKVTPQGSGAVLTRIAVGAPAPAPTPPPVPIPPSEPVPPVPPAPPPVNALVSLNDVTRLVNVLMDGILNLTPRG